MQCRNVSLNIHHRNRFIRLIHRYLNPPQNVKPPVEIKPLS
nr:MAG TPA: hypothetical protein [Caudoviricetes sp.]